MPKSPCQNCPHRAVICHDSCEEYDIYHDALVMAKKDLDRTYEVIDYLIKAAAKRRRRANVK